MANLIIQAKMMIFMLNKYQAKIGCPILPFWRKAIILKFE